MVQTIGIRAGKATHSRDISIFAGEPLRFEVTERPQGAVIILTIGMDFADPPLLEEHFAELLDLDVAQLSVIAEGTTGEYNIWLRQGEVHSLLQRGRLSVRESIEPVIDGGGDEEPDPDPLSISGTPAPGALVGAAYAFAPLVTGGTAPYAFALTAGALPEGLGLNALSGEISGIAAAAQTAAGLILQVSDAAGQQAALAAFAITVASAEAPLLMIVAGQSNARSAGNSSATPDAKYTTGAALADVHILQLAPGVADATFAPYDITRNADPDNSGRAWGSEAEFIYRMRVQGDTRPVYIVKEAGNGQDLHTHWSPATIGDRFDRLEAKVARARALVAEGFGEDVTLWNQGEADANLQATADAYAANWTAFLAAFRTRISTGLVIAERIRPLGYAAAGVTDDRQGFLNAWTVREATLAGVAADANAVAIDTDFLPSNFGSLHPPEPWTAGRGLRAHAAYTGSYDATYGPITDTAPDPIAFEAATGVDPSAVISTLARPVTGIERQTPITVSGGAWRSLNALDDDGVIVDWTTGDGVLDKYQKLQLRVVAPESFATTATMTGTVGGVGFSFAVTTTTAVSGLEPETEAFIAQALALGSGTMTAAQRSALDAFYATAKASTWWPKLDGCYVKVQDQIASSLDLVTRQARLSNVGSQAGYAWDSQRGWYLPIGIDSNVGLRMDGLVPSAGGIGWAQTDASFWISYSKLATNTRGDAISGTQFYARFMNTGAGRIRINNSTNVNLTGLPVTAGMRGVSRIGTTINVHGAGGEMIATTATPTESVAITALGLGQPSADNGVVSDAEFNGIAVGAGLTAAEAVDFTAAYAALGAAF